MLVGMVDLGWWCHCMRVNSATGAVGGGVGWWWWLERQLSRVVIIVRDVIMPEAEVEVSVSIVCWHICQLLSGLIAVGMRLRVGDVIQWVWDDELVLRVKDCKMLMLVQGDRGVFGSN